MPASPGPFDQLWDAYQKTGRLSDHPDLADAVLDILRPAACVVRRAMGNHPALGDLVSAGAVGLLEALQRYDPAQGVQLSTFASWRIVGAMYDEHRKAHWAKGAIRVKAQRARTAVKELRQSLGRCPDDQELAAALDLSPADLAEIRPFIHHPRPLALREAEREDRDAPSPPPPEDRRQDPIRVLLAAEARTRLLDALKSLPHHQRYTLLLYYFERLTLAQIGAVLGLSQPRVHQIRAEALQRMVKRLGPDGPQLLDAFGE